MLDPDKICSKALTSNAVNVLCFRPIQWKGWVGLHNRTRCNQLQVQRLDPDVCSGYFFHSKHFAWRNDGTFDTAQAGTKELATVRCKNTISGKGEAKSGHGIGVMPLMAKTAQMSQSSYVSVSGLCQLHGRGWP